MIGDRREDYEPLPLTDWEQALLDGRSPGTRPSEQEWLLRMAETVSQRATCSRLSVGAVVARDGRILSTGYNGAPRGEPHCDHTYDQNSPCLVSVHAEENALIHAGYHGVQTYGASLYLTHAPCYSCAGRIINAGIERVVFGQFFRSYDGITRLVKRGLSVGRGD